MNDSIFACRNPAKQFWEVGHLPIKNGFLTIVGWRVVPRPVDAGVPEKIAGVLARAMISVARVTFPCSDIGQSIPNDWIPIGDDFAIQLKADLIKRISSKFSAAPADVNLLSTQKARTVAKLFDDAYFHWSKQSQIALLSAPDGNLPKINRKLLLTLFEDEWAERTMNLQETKIKCVVRPGVDGILAAFLSVSKEFEEEFLTVLEAETKIADLNWEIVSEDKFAEFAS